MRPCLNALMVSALAGCTFTNEIDICERKLPPPTVANRRYDGHQAVTTSGALAALPEGGAYLAFASEALARPDSIEVLGTRLSDRGTPERDCDTAEDRERVLDGIDPTLPGAQLRNLPYLAAPAFAGGLGIVTHASQNDGGATHIAARFVAASGCLSRGNTFEVGTIPASGFIQSWPVAVSVGKPGAEEFVIAWTAAVGSAREIMARVVTDTGFAVPQFLGTERSPAGAAVPLLPAERSAFHMAMARLGEGRFALVYESTPSDGTSQTLVQLTIFDSRLRVLRGPIEVARSNDLGATLQQHEVAVSFDGANILVLWVAGDTLGLPRVHGRLYSGAGELLAGEISPGGAPFRASAAKAGQETAIAVSPLRQGGFIVGWRERGVQPSGGALRGMIIGADGRRLFSNQACDRTDFALATGAGDDARMALATLANGAVMAAYSDFSATGPDTSGASVRVLTVSLADLVPRGRLPVQPAVDAAALSAPDVRASSPPDGGAALPDSSGSCASDATSSACPSAGPIADGMPCRSDMDCHSGAICLSESITEFPGGICFRECRPRQKDCSPGADCLATSSDKGYCFASCDSPSACGPGRLCIEGSCLPHCVRDSECSTGRCNIDAATCSSKDVSLKARSWEPCTRSDDCRSGFCRRDGRCSSICKVSDPVCPDGLRCLSLDSYDEGMCVPSCESQSCPPGGFQCVAGYCGPR